MADRSPLPGDPKIAVRRLNVWYGDRHVLHDVDLDVPANAVTAIIGPSGCGKTTFLRTLNRMNELVDGLRTEGSVALDGRDIYDGEKDVNDLRREVGMVFQRPNPFPKSIFDNVAYGPRLHGERRKAQLDEVVERSLRKAALWDEVKDDLRSSALRLSDGQRQRLCIARTLAVQPQILLMDEPSSALDPIATSRIEDLMFELKRELTILLVTHNMQQAQRASDYTGFFLQGRLVEFEPTSTLFLRPRERATEDYVSGRFG